MKNNENNNNNNNNQEPQRTLYIVDENNLSPTSLVLILSDIAKDPSATVKCISRDIPIVGDNDESDDSSEE